MLILFDVIDRYDSADLFFSFCKDQLLYCIVPLVEMDVMVHVYECYTIYHQLLFFSQMASDLVSRQ